MQNTFIQKQITIWKPSSISDISNSSKLYRKLWSMNLRNLLSHRIFQGIMPILISYVYVSTERLFIQIDYDFHLQYTVYTTICSLQVKIILSVEGFSNEVNRDSRLKSRASKKLGSKNWSIGLRGLQSTHRSTLVLQNHCISTCIYRL